MASWSELAKNLANQENVVDWLYGSLTGQLREVSKLRKATSVIFYASAFLQKKNSTNVSIDREDINGFMDSIYKAQTDNGLTLILHTPGGDIYAVESIVDYLHAKFSKIEVIVPYLFMSGGAMMSLASDLVILGKQSQLGPIDPQFSAGNKSYSARAIEEGFNNAKKDIEKDTSLAHLWAPILQSMGPSLITESQRALSYSKELVKKWLKERMFKDEDEKEREKIINDIAGYFNAEKKDGDGGTKLGQVHVHGQRIGFQKLEELGVRVEKLEKSQPLQTAVLTAYHLMTLIFERSPSLKFISSDQGTMWSKQQQIRTQ